MNRDYGSNWEKQQKKGCFSFSGFVARYTLQRMAAPKMSFLTFRKIEMIYLGPLWSKWGKWSKSSVLTILTKLGQRIAGPKFQKNEKLKIKKKDKNDKFVVQ